MKPTSTDRICPRCNSDYSSLAIRRDPKSNREYWYAIHRYKHSSGKWSTRSCYLGLVKYEYVTKTNPLELGGYTDPTRTHRYLIQLLDQLPMLISKLSRDKLELLRSKLRESMELLESANSSFRDL